MGEARISELRASLEARLREQDPGFLAADLDRLQADAYLKRFLLHHDNDVKDALDMVWDTLTWRKTSGASALNETNINMDYINEGAFFPHGRDIDGRLLLIFKCKMHTKGQKDFDELKKCIIYWFDRVEREENGEPITLFFDMDGCGLSNMDMEFTKYLISMVKLYYPLMLNYIIIFEMPWVLSAAFKIIKQLLPAKAVSKMKFLNRANLKDYVPLDQALAIWGGRSEYEFVFTPEAKESASPEHTPKKVTFAEQGDGQHSLGEMLRLNPNDTIIFKNENEEISGQFILTNMDEGAISFKIRTTSPEKFRVRPSAGTLTKGASQVVLITVQPGFHLRTVTKDRFLVLCVQIPKTTLTPAELSEVWQKSTGSKVDEYRLKCQFPEKEVAKNGNVLDGLRDSDRQIATLTSTLNSIRSNSDSIRADINFVKRLQMVSILLLVVAIVIGVILLRRPYSHTSVFDGYCEGDRT